MARQLPQLALRSLLSCWLFVACSTTKVEVQNRTLLVDGKPFFIKSVCYSPVPVGQSADWPPFGDYFSQGYEALWKRDLPMIRAMGANAIRVYSWTITTDHSLFLRTAKQHGLYVIPTFDLSLDKYKPQAGPQWRDQFLLDFKGEVQAYKDEPALLFWIFGNELNLPQNLWLTQLDEENNCGWIEQKCFNSNSTACEQPRTCVYKALFDLIESAASNAKSVDDAHPITSAFSDTDNIVDTLYDNEGSTPSIDIWAVQVYRGKTFGIGEFDFFSQFASASTRPLFISEFGIDAFSDPCGHPNATNVTALTQPGCDDDKCGPHGMKFKLCYNTEHNSSEYGINYLTNSSYGEDESSQAAWIVSLTQALLNHSSFDGVASWGDRVAIGGSVLEWVDEWWKTHANTAASRHNHAHCPTSGVSKPALCGGYLEVTFDLYVNEGWFGLMHRGDQCGDGVELIRPRRVYHELLKLWGGDATVKFATCSDLVGDKFPTVLVTCGVSVALVLFCGLAVVVSKHIKRSSVMQEPFLGSPS